MKYSISELWQLYQKELVDAGNDRAYINAGDYVKLLDYEGLTADRLPIEIDDTLLKYAGLILPVINSYKAGTDLWYHEVRTADGKTLTLIDADIDEVYKKAELFNQKEQKNYGNKNKNQN